MKRVLGANPRTAGSTATGHRLARRLHGAGKARLAPRERQAKWRRAARGHHSPSTHAKINGAQIVASLSMMNFGVVAASLPQVIFSFGTAPE